MVAEIRRAEGEAEVGEVGIWPEHWDIVAAYLAVSSQWRVVSLMGGGLRYLGLDYTAVRARLDGGPIALTPAVWDGLQIMEVEIRAVFNSR